MFDCDIITTKPSQLHFHQVFDWEQIEWYPQYTKLWLLLMQGIQEHIQMLIFEALSYPELKHKYIQYNNQ